MVVGTVVHSSPVANAVMNGLGGLAAVTALWSLLAGDPTRDYLALAVVGFALFLAPWVAGLRWWRRRMDGLDSRLPRHRPRVSQGTCAASPSISAAPSPTPRRVTVNGSADAVEYVISPAGVS
ncbi:hypothetical protein ACFZC5_17575 [Nocardia gamkensis]|uniref:hypothetical protein n=1 Tax=Nocardia gamkensis TaxID=352869 RepID=UPI0036E49B04